MAPFIRIIHEIDFFDESRPRVKRLLVASNHSSCLKETLFPEILGPSAKRARVEDQTDDHLDQEDDVHHHPIIKKGKVSTFKLFGKFIDVITTHDDDGDQDKKALNPSSKKRRNPTTKKRSNRNKPRLVHPQNLEPSAPLPDTILQGIQRRGGSEYPVLLFKKTLEQWDVEPHQNRVYVTKSGRLIEALTEEERGKVDRDKDSLDVPTLDPNGNEYALQLTRWHSVGEDVLKRDWLKLVRANELKAGDRVEGWGYRRDDGMFCLALGIFNKPN